MTKNQFLAAILNFHDQTGSRIFEPIFFTNLYYRSWKFAIRILKIYQWVLNLSAKTRFSAAILKFYDHTGSRIYEPIYLTNHYHRSWKFTVKILKISQLVLKLLAKTGFRRLFWIFLAKQEVDFSNSHIFLITTIELENMPLESLKYLN